MYWKREPVFSSHWRKLVAVFYFELSCEHWCLCKYVIDALQVFWRLIANFDKFDNYRKNQWFWKWAFKNIMVDLVAVIFAHIFDSCHILNKLCAIKIQNDVHLLNFRYMPSMGHSIVILLLKHFQIWIFLLMSIVVCPKFWKRWHLWGWLRKFVQMIIWLWYEDVKIPLRKLSLISDRQPFSEESVTMYFLAHLCRKAHKVSL